MQTHEELVEEVYNNMSFRSEFISYIKLNKALKSELQALVQAALQLPAPWSEKSLDSLRYSELINKSDSLPPQLAGLIRDGNSLYSSLSAGLCVNYNLTNEQGKILLEDVMARYE